MMSKTKDVSQVYSFSSPIDMVSMLEQLEIQYIDVNHSRALVIFGGAILNLECLEGDLTNLERIEITLYDLPSNSDTESETEAALEVINDFKSLLPISEDY